uniref:Uncharacterized protein n=1 Tax=Chromera velia CCMP2878 TaxID=1169474 RepID=A0A0G4GRM8_9ALVE|eukprot:Cvel_23085.t1-p1 / transcript=Cvel_23085.t1 / gene=Cvel_23085 / organism=Chromera_velia_CCMP2878 / gene_product=hypothetical protein / transcript_product=hypothetical protein / location=Cvel_scaffold2339:4561-10160(-) / protein_length=1163 / sequence_SO=supercontig / SO=protein_coding / is_pseudo=false
MGTIPLPRIIDFCDVCNTCVPLFGRFRGSSSQPNYTFPSLRQDCMVLWRSYGRASVQLLDLFVWRYSPVVDFKRCKPLFLIAADLDASALIVLVAYLSRVGGLQKDELARLEVDFLDICEWSLCKRISAGDCSILDSAWRPTRMPLRAPTDGEGSVDTYTDKDSLPSEAKPIPVPSLAPFSSRPTQSQRSTTCTSRRERNDRADCRSLADASCKNLKKAPYSNATYGQQTGGPGVSPSSRTNTNTNTISASPVSSKATVVDLVGRLHQQHRSKGAPNSTPVASSVGDNSANSNYSRGGVLRTRTVGGRGGCGGGAGGPRDTPPSGAPSVVLRGNGSSTFASSTRPASAASARVRPTTASGPLQRGMALEQADRESLSRRERKPQSDASRYQQQQQQQQGNNFHVMGGSKYAVREEESGAGAYFHTTTTTTTSSVNTCRAERGGGSGRHIRTARVKNLKSDATTDTGSDTARCRSARVRTDTNGMGVPAFSVSNSTATTSASAYPGGNHGGRGSGQSSMFGSLSVSRPTSASASGSCSGGVAVSLSARLRPAPSEQQQQQQCPSLQGHPRPPSASASSRRSHVQTENEGDLHLHGGGRVDGAEGGGGVQGAGCPPRPSVPPSLSLSLAHLHDHALLSGRHPGGEAENIPTPGGTYRGLSSRQAAAASDNQGRQPGSSRAHRGQGTVTPCNPPSASSVGAGWSRPRGVACPPVPSNPHRCTPQVSSVSLSGGCCASSSSSFDPSSSAGGHLDRDTAAAAAAASLSLAGGVGFPGRPCLSSRRPTASRGGGSGSSGGTGPGVVLATSRSSCGRTGASSGGVPPGVGNQSSLPPFPVPTPCTNPNLGTPSGPSQSNHRILTTSQQPAPRGCNGWENSAIWPGGQVDTPGGIRFRDKNPVRLPPSDASFVDPHCYQSHRQAVDGVTHCSENLIIPCNENEGELNASYFCGAETYLSRNADGTPFANLFRAGHVSAERSPLSNYASHASAPQGSFCGSTGADYPTNSLAEMTDREHRVPPPNAIHSLVYAPPSAHAAAFHSVFSRQAAPHPIVTHPPQNCHTPSSATSSLHDKVHGGNRPPMAAWFALALGSRDKQKGRGGGNREVDSSSTLGSSCVSHLTTPAVGVGPRGAKVAAGVSPQGHRLAVHAGAPQYASRRGASLIDRQTTR